jgi:hypothetical protein
MIRCIPVDGSPAFEVENDVSAVGVICSYRVDKLADPERGDGEDHSYLVDGKECRIESWRERAERLDAALDATFGADTPWPLPEVLAKLAHAADTLFETYNYDGHGYEEIVSARDAARALLTSFREMAQR